MKREDLFRSGTYAGIPKSLLAVPSKTLSPAAKLVWMAVVERFGQNDCSWPGAGQIARDTGLTRKGVQKAVDQLRALKLLTVQPGQRGGDSNRYWLTEFASVQSSLANGVRHPSEQSTLDSEQSTLGASVQSSHELPNRTTQPTTKVTTEGEAASPPAAPSGGSPSKAVGVDAPSSSPARDATDPPVKPKLTDDLLRLLKSDATGEQMVGYFCHGSAAIGKPLAAWQGFEPSNTHWAPQTRNYDRPEPGVKVPALAAYCWCRFTQARGQAGESIELPAFGKLLGTIKSLRARMTQEEIVGRIDCIAANWPAIKAALAWMSSPPVLNEVALHDRHIIELSNRLARGENIAAARPAPSSNLSPGWQIPQNQNPNPKEDKYAHLYS